ncbi:hypothetical protein LTR09_006365 [Extremus antarcticus]|uniref:Uncharacterized protein n=1 Tax=Extremus antarcticus TaxID=702011 RepID=A0AAJ0DEP2_9PEZI|nr:hypothetical protein LTR09_006365 [Extremus antarcticus]
MSWSPFRLDALRLVTLLGADEVARAIGSWMHNSLTDYLPVLGAFKVVSDQIAAFEPGFSLYNISDGIWLTELAPWFTRWLAIHMNWNYTVLYWDVEEKESRERSKSHHAGASDELKPPSQPSSSSSKMDRFGAMLVGLVLNFGLLAVAPPKQTGTALQTPER